MRFLGFDVGTVKWESLCLLAFDAGGVESRCATVGGSGAGIRELEEEAVDFLGCEFGEGADGGGRESLCFLAFDARGVESRCATEDGSGAGIGELEEEALDFLERGFGSGTTRWSCWLRDRACTCAVASASSACRT